MMVRVCLIAVFCIFLLCGCTLFDRGVQSSPQRLAEAYLEAFKNGDYDLMLSYCQPEAETTEEQEFTRNFLEMIQLVSYSVDRVEIISHEEALVDVTISLELFGSQRTATDRIKMINVDKKWYVSAHPVH